MAVGHQALLAGAETGGRAGPGPPMVPKFTLNIWILIKLLYKLAWLPPLIMKKTNSWLRPCLWHLGLVVIFFPIIAEVNVATESLFSRKWLGRPEVSWNEWSLVMICKRQRYHSDQNNKKRCAYFICFFKSAAFICWGHPHHPYASEHFLFYCIVPFRLLVDQYCHN